MNKIVNWKVKFEYEDGTMVEMERVLDDHRDVEYIDNTIASAILNAGLWKEGKK